MIQTHITHHTNPPTHILIWAQFKIFQWLEAEVVLSADTHAFETYMVKKKERHASRKAKRA